MKTIRVGSRDSVLAVVQAELVMAAIAEAQPELPLQLVTMKTTGDKILDKRLDEIGGKGLFMKELDEALADGRVDITVHSGKDIPMELPEELPLVAFSRRADPRDVLILPEGAGEMDPSKPIGCSSLRRTAQLRELYPEMEVASVRGNVQTRLGKLDSGEYSALVLAAAGIERLDLLGRVSRFFTPDEILPAAVQGIIVVQARQGEDVEYLAGADDADGRACALAERAFVRRLDGGCSSPIAAFAELDGDEIYIRGFVVDAHGKPFKSDIRGAREDGEALGTALAQKILDAGVL